MPPERVLGGGENARTFFYRLPATKPLRDLSLFACVAMQHSIRYPQYRPQKNTEAYPLRAQTSAFGFLGGFMRFLSALALAMLIPHFVCEAQNSFVGKYRRTTSSTGSVLGESLERDTGIPIALQGLPQVFSPGARIVVNGTLAGDILKVSEASYEKQIPKAIGLKRVQVLLAQFEGESFPFNTVYQIEGSLNGTTNSVRTYFERVSGNQLTYQFTRSSGVKLPARSTIKDGQLRIALTTALQAQGYNPAAFDHTVIFAPEVATDSFFSSVFRDLKLSLVETDLTQPTKIVRETKQQFLRLHGLSYATTLRCVDPLGNVTPLAGTCTIESFGDKFSGLNDSATSGEPNTWEKNALGWIPSTSVVAPTTSGIYTIASRDRTFSGATALKLPFGQAPTTLSRWTGQQYDLWLEFYDSTAETGSLPGEKLLIPRVVPRHRATETSYDNTTAILLKNVTGSTTQALQGGQSFTPPGTNITITPLGLVDGATPQAPKNFRVHVNIPTTASAKLALPPLVPKVTFASTIMTAHVGKKFSKVTPKQEGGVVTSCSVTPALPKGLSLRAASCSIAGRPKKISRLKTYTVSAANASGALSTTIQLEVKKAAKGRSKRS